MSIARFQMPDGRIGRFEVPDGTSPEQAQQMISAQIGGQDAISTGGITDSGGDVGAIAPDRIPDRQGARLGGADEQPVSLVDEAAGFLEPAATLVTGAIAEPLAGIGGLAKTITSGPEEGAKTVAAIREGLTFQPRTEAGKKGLETAGEVLEPIAKGLQSAEEFLGDETFEATGSPALAAAATTIPTVLMEALGIASVKGGIKLKDSMKQASQNRQIKRAVVEAAPDIEQLKDTSRAVFKELDDSGVVVKKQAFNSLPGKIEADFREQGFFRDIAPGLAPKADAALKTIESVKGKDLTLPEVNAIRKTAEKAAASIDPGEKALGLAAIDTIDKFIDDLKPSDLNKGNLKASEIMPKYRVARELWGRARRSEIIADAFNSAEIQASGFENGIVSQFRSIINNKKKSRYFKPQELSAMRDVVKGGGIRDISKTVGRLGFSEGHATNVLGGLAGVATGRSLGGITGGVLVPTIGQVSRKLAQRLTKGKAEFADTIIRAGADGEKIAAAYLARTQKSARSAEELSELLARPDIALDELMLSNNPIIRDAAQTAQGTRVLQAVAATAAGAGAIKEQQNVR